MIIKTTDIMYTLNNPSTCTFEVEVIRYEGVYKIVTKNGETRKYLR